MYLIDVLSLIESDMSNGKRTDIRPNSDYEVSIRFMSENETWIQTYPEHPILVPYYQSKVDAITPVDDKAIAIWIAEDDWFPVIPYCCGTKPKRVKTNDVTEINDGG